MSNKPFNYKPSKSIVYAAVSAAVALGIISATLIAMNAAPYTALCRYVVENVNFGHLAFLSPLVDWIPGSGAFLQWLNSQLANIVGMLAYAVVQITEISWILVFHNREMLKLGVEGVERDRGDQFAIDEDRDTKTVQALKKSYNTFVSEILDKLFAAKWVAYGIDCALLFWYYPLTGSLGALDWGGIVTNAMILFAIEGILIVVFWILNFQTYYAPPKTKRVG